MRTVFFLLAACLFSAPSASAQTTASSDADSPMDPLAFLAGEWEGEGWMMVGPNQRHTFVQKEHVETRLDGNLMLIEGLGRASEDTSRVVHHAFAVVSYNAADGLYVMRAHRANGAGTQSIDAEATVEDGAFVWGFDDPRAGTIRYTIREDADGRWFEIGEMSRDGGATWFQFFEMTLERVDA